MKRVFSFLLEAKPLWWSCLWNHSVSRLGAEITGTCRNPMAAWYFSIYLRGFFWESYIGFLALFTVNIQTTIDYANPFINLEYTLIYHTALHWRIHCVSSKEALYLSVYCTEVGPSQNPAVWITLWIFACFCLYIHIYLCNELWSAFTRRWHITGVNQDVVFHLKAAVCLHISHTFLEYKNSISCLLRQFYIISLSI